MQKFRLRSPHKLHHVDATGCLLYNDPDVSWSGSAVMWSGFTNESDHFGGMHVPLSYDCITLISETHPMIRRFESPNSKPEGRK